MDTVSINSGKQLASVLIHAHPTLSPQLQKIAQFVLDHPAQVALSTIADLSARLNVQPSSFIRFSKAIGFKGFSDVQRILKTEAQAEAPTSYFDRIRQQVADPTSNIGRFAQLAESSLTCLPSQHEIDAAAAIMVKAPTIHIMGHRRAFGVASYLNYMLGQFEARVNLLAFVGGMREARHSLIASGDCVVTITFPTYTNNTLDATQEAKDRGAKIIGISDSLVSPIAKFADTMLLTDPATDAGFRSPVGAMVTAQALAVTYGEMRQI